MRHTPVATCAAAAFAMNSIPQVIDTESAHTYELTATVALGSPDRWDLVVFDPDSKRVYVAHGTKNSVVDGQKETLNGTIGAFAGDTQGIGISTATGTGYTDDGEAGVVVPFNLATLKPESPIPAAPDADGIVYDPASNHILVVNGESGSVTVIDPRINAGVATITVGAELDSGVVDGKEKKFFVGGAKNHEIVRINTATNTVDAHWAIPSCKTPREIAIDPQARRPFVTCADNLVVIVNDDAGNNIATLPIGSFSDGAAFDPVGNPAFSSNGDGTLSIIQERDSNTFVSWSTIKTMPGAGTIAIDPKTGRLFLAAVDIAKIDSQTTPRARRQVKVIPGSVKQLILDPIT